jgi:hypothetical protein
MALKVILMALKVILADFLGLGAGTKRLVPARGDFPLGNPKVLGDCQGVKWVKKLS